MRKMCGKRPAAAADDDIVRSFKRLQVTPSPSPAHPQAPPTAAADTDTQMTCDGDGEPAAYHQINEQLRQCHEWRMQREREREAAAAVHRRPPDATQGK